MDCKFFYLFSVLCSAAINFPKTYAMGHGEQVQLHHFAIQSQQVFVSVVPEAFAPKVTLAKWSLPKGLQVVVTKELPKVPKQLAHSFKFAKHVWEPGRLLAGVEIQIGIEVPEVLSRLNSAKKILKTEDFVVVDLDLKEHAELAQNPLVFVDLASQLEKITYEKNQTELKPNLFSQNRLNKVVLEPNSERILKTIRQLSGEEETDSVSSSFFATASIGEKIPERGSEDGRKSSQQFMKEQFEKLGLQSELKCYEYRNYKGCNVQATLEGIKPEKIVLVTAHLDSVNNKGADDDASGIAALLEIATLAREMKPQYSLRFVGFDQEELGLIGSKAYVQQLSSAQKESILSVFQMDMIGYDSNKDGAIHAMNCGRKDSIPLTTAIQSNIAEFGSALKIVEACTNRSDHASFWAENIPATIVSENFFGDRKTKPDGNKCYHKKCDTVELIDISYSTNVVKLVANAAWEFANK